jgi:hypothetical protein
MDTGRSRKSLISEKAGPKSDEYALELNSILAAPPENIRSLMPAAHQWLIQNGVLSDWQKNSLVIDMLSSIPFLDNIDLEYVSDKSYLRYVVYVDNIRLLLFPFWSAYYRKMSTTRKLLSYLWSAVFYPFKMIGFKNIIINRVKELTTLYTPQFNVDLVVIYGRKKRSNTIQAN